MYRIIGLGNAYWPLHRLALFKDLCVRTSSNAIHDGESADILKSDPQCRSGVWGKLELPSIDGRPCPECQGIRLTSNSKHASHRVPLEARNDDVTERKNRDGEFSERDLREDFPAQYRSAVIDCPAQQQGGGTQTDDHRQRGAKVWIVVVVWLGILMAAHMLAIMVGRRLNA